MSKYYVADPDNTDTTSDSGYENLDHAMTHANELLAVYKKNAQEEGEWSMSVEDIAIYKGDNPETVFDEGELVASSTKTNIQKKPDDTDIDGYSPSLDLTFDSDDQEYCDYEMRLKTKDLN